MKRSLFVAILTAMLCSGCGDYRDHETGDFRAVRHDLHIHLIRVRDRVTEALNAPRTIQAYFVAITAVFSQAEYLDEDYRNYNEQLIRMGCAKKCPHRSMTIENIKWSARHLASIHSDCKSINDRIDAGNNAVTSNEIEQLKKIAHDGMAYLATFKKELDEAIMQLEQQGSIL